MSAAQEQHRGFCSILQGASVTLRTIPVLVGGTIYYNNHTLEPFKELGL
jgi:tRNA A37 N6-isopentenylltransferase MiaA